jgi:hypothetical protein
LLALFFLGPLAIAVARLAASAKAKAAFDAQAETAEDTDTVGAAA